MGTVNGDVQIHDISQPDRDRVVYAASFDPIMDVSRFGRPLRVAESRRSFAEDFQRRWAMHVHSIVFSPGDDLLAVTLGDGSLTLIQIETGDIVGRGGRVAQVLDLDVSPDGRWLATCGSDATVHIWKLSLDAKDPVRDAYEPFVVLSTLDLASAIRLEPDPSGTADPGNVRTWLTSVAFQSDSRKLAVCGNAGPVYVFDMDTIQRETQRPAADLYERVEQEMGIRLENDRPVPLESLRLVPVGGTP